MPTTYVDQFWIFDPYAPPAAGTVLTVSTFNIVDNNDNNLINRFSNDRIDGSDIRASYPGDTVTVTLPGGGTVTITGVTFYLADGRQVFTPTDGSILQTSALVSTTWVSSQGSTTPASLAPPCFTPGTLIAIAGGHKLVESLQAGELVQTADKGLAAIRLVHMRTLSADHLKAYPNHGPVRISAGSLGQELPGRDLIVSPQHRILIRSNIAERMFGQREILVPACQLVGMAGISRVKQVGEVTYIHILLDHHAVIYAENTPTETLFLGKQVHESLSPREIEKIRIHFRYVSNFAMEPARLLVRGVRLKKLLERHMSNNKPLLEEETHQPELMFPTG
ncbi:MAG: type I secretion protein [Marinosulfonomonas sp.]|nr:MAG: type I secretion protein [Marinosulfonomonas sp.]